MERPNVNPALIRWARQRSGLSAAPLRKRFPALPKWESGDAKPTLKQLEKYAKAVFVPIGYLFLDQPPVESVPVPDFRSGVNRSYSPPSPNLLDTVYICQQRQEWYREYARTTGVERKFFVGSLTIASDIEESAAAIRKHLHFDLEQRRQCPTWTEALRHFLAQADESGIMVMCSGVVLNNNRRKLDPGEFRGFAIADDLAPLIFVNGADTKSAQMFTLAHELCHLWIAQTGLSDADPRTVPTDVVERWCNRVAAELLVPRQIIIREFRPADDLSSEVSRLARRFKVSTLVILRRLFDIDGITRDEFFSAYDAELARLLAIPGGSGGDFYLTHGVRVSKRFASALVESTLEGNTLFRDAFRMLGISRIETFREIGRSLNIPS